MQSQTDSTIEDTRIHLHIALDLADDPQEKRHIREALQLLERFDHGEER